MLADTLEQVQLSPSKRATYVRLALAALTAIVAFKTFWFARWGGWADRELADFDAFHIVAQRVWRGDLDQIYHFAALLKMQLEAAGGATGFMPWTYPPQYALLLAPLAFLPVGLAYLLFTAGTLALYLAVLRRIADVNFAHVLVILFPALAITIGSGQNGFLTGALIALVCLNVERRPLLAGLALGAMVIKPHLAIAVGVYLLATRHWIALATATAVVLASSLLCTLLFGWQIWTAWLGAIKESASYLEQGFYPLYRMVSAYAALYQAGLSANISFWGQVIVAALALCAVLFATARATSSSFALGIAVMVSVMISPYAYDYDLPILGIGLALILPDLAGLASPRIRSWMYGLILLAGAYGLLQSARLAVQKPGQDFAPALGGFALMALLLLLLGLLWRQAQLAPASSQAAQQRL
ncbi:glycosyltransferase family 87 protein [Bradyrhizobium stylosanthis]|uniref:glycosyltransferase family 87 protein n=1 Tax=Bradyrhizobium stylosanthis TaxID=1803665 RepID=UPI0007C46F9A|nr:glycosyltransferase family 87 protein [Bradyrhizobium stylosanthis]